MVKSLLSVCLLLALCAGCKTVNPDRCCVDAADCAKIGIDDEMHACGEGLACVANECVVATCSTQGCAATAPVCNITTDVCDGCAADTDCERFADQSVCDTSSGACVGCLGDADCSASAPICDTANNTCRGCTLDRECASGACGDDGACIADAAAVYLDPAGADTGECTKSAPCRSFPFAISRTGLSRSHVVMAPGVYNIDVSYTLSPSATAAPSIHVHGGGANLVGQFPENVALSLEMPTTMRDLTITTEGSQGIRVAPNSIVTMQRVDFRSGIRALLVDGELTLRDFKISTLPGQGNTAIVGVGVIKLDRGTIEGFTTAVSNVRSIFATNVLMHGQYSLALNIPDASGLLEFVTIAHVGADQTVAPRAVRCNPNLTVKNSIIWAPGTNPVAAISGCNVVSSIVGPVAITGVPNTDPQFQSPGAQDFHLRSNSPAKDIATSGPPLDFEGQSRPNGPGYDLGADEVQ